MYVHLARIYGRRSSTPIGETGRDDDDLATTRVYMALSRIYTLSERSKSTRASVLHECPFGFRPSVGMTVARMRDSHVAIFLLSPMRTAMFRIWSITETRVTRQWTKETTLCERVASPIVIYLYTRSLMEIDLLLTPSKSARGYSAKSFPWYAAIVIATR